MSAMPAASVPSPSPGTDNRTRSCSRFRLSPRSGSVPETPEPMLPDAIRTRPGQPYPLGASWTGAGVNFALFSEHATGVELCLFDPADLGREIRRVPLRERTDHVWHVFL